MSRKPSQPQNQHTPGPWGCIDTSYHAHDYRLTKADGTALPLNVEHAEQRANARLIAAVPELLDALRDLQGQLRHAVKMDVKKHYSLMVADAAATKAIAKAEGVL